MKYVLLILCMVLVGCDYKLKDDYVYQNEQLKAQVKDLENRLYIALNINTCWTSHLGKFYKLGKYEKETDLYADLKVFVIVESYDIKGNPVKIWVEAKHIASEDVRKNNYKIKCDSIKP